MTTSRPPLVEVPLRWVWPPRLGLCYCTVSPGQWDELLAACYAVGWVLLEVDDGERIVRAYCSPAGN